MDRPWSDCQSRRPIKGESQITLHMLQKDTSGKPSSSWSEYNGCDLDWEGCFETLLPWPESSVPETNVIEKSSISLKQFVVGDYRVFETGDVFIEGSSLILA